MEEKKVLKDEKLEKVNGGICWPVKYAVDLSKPQCGIDGNELTQIIGPDGTPMNLPDNK